MKKQIILSILTALVLLLGGCGPNSGTDESNTTDNNTNIETPKAPVNPYKTAGWYGKTQVSLNANGKIYRHSTAGVFGELVQSKEGKDQHDIESYGATTFQIVFPQTEWGDDNGDYFSNYQKYREGTSDKKSWLFQIKAAGTSSFPIIINLDGVYDVRYKEENGTVSYKESTEVNQTILNELHLVDVDNGNVYTIADLETVNLTMDRLATRTFRWVLGTVDSTDYEALSSPQRAAGRSAITLDFKAAAQQKSGGKFGLPPQ